MAFQSAQTCYNVARTVVGVLGGVLGGMDAFQAVHVHVCRSTATRPKWFAICTGAKICLRLSKLSN